jgi:hypothetical protein
VRGDERAFEVSLGDTNPGRSVPSKSVGADELHGVALVPVVEQRIVELGIFGDRLQLVFTERFGIFLALPWLDLPSCLSVVGRDAGQREVRRLVAHLVGTFVLLAVRRFESAAADEPARSTHCLKSLDAIGSSDCLR